MYTKNRTRKRNQPGSFYTLSPKCKQRDCLGLSKTIFLIEKNSSLQLDRFVEFVLQKSNINPSECVVINFLKIERNISTWNKHICVFLKENAYVSRENWFGWNRDGGMNSNTPFLKLCISEKPVLPLYFLDPYVFLDTYVFLDPYAHLCILKENAYVSLTHMFKLCDNLRVKNSSWNILDNFLCYK